MGHRPNRARLCYVKGFTPLSCQPQDWAMPFAWYSIPMVFAAVPGVRHLSAVDTPATLNSIRFALQGVHTPVAQRSFAQPVPPTLPLVAALNLSSCVIYVSVRRRAWPAPEFWLLGCFLASVPAMHERQTEILWHRTEDDSPSPPSAPDGPPPTRHRPTPYVAP